MARAARLDRHGPWIPWGASRQRGAHHRRDRPGLERVGVHHRLGLRWAIGAWDGRIWINQDKNIVGRSAIATTR